MGSKEWREAAKMASEQGKRPEPNPAEIEAAIRELEQFMKSDDGAAALELLEATDRHIILYESEPQAGSVTVIFLGRRGLTQSIEAGGMSAAYSKPREPRLNPVLPDAAIKAATHPEMGGRKPSDVLPYLRKRLDEIADEFKKG